ncbi:MAG TPA: site-specific DNA-methyltransferase [Puia sp.]|nr:site-specific DNA-methyltransferase [Puia sp.]
MATGETKGKWQNKTNIVNRQSYEENNIGYTLDYTGKVPLEAILKAECSIEYKLLLRQNISLEENIGNYIFYGDNLDVMRHLLDKMDLKGKIALIYIDPPYGTNSIFQSRENTESYKDDLIGANYLEFLRQRLILMREILSDLGSIYLHLDGNMIFQAKIIMDEIFGVKNFKNCITRKKCSNKNSTRNSYGNVSDYILFYTKTDKYIWNRPMEPWTEEKIKKEYNNIEPETGRRFKKVPIHAPGIRNGETGKPWRGMLPPAGKHWQFTPKKLDALHEKGEIYWSENGNPRRKIYHDQSEGISIQDIWFDLQDSLNQNIKITGYPTEKTPMLLRRIIEASSNKGDIVMDCFAGSGTTLGEANDLNRKWIGIDNSSEAIEHIFKRFVRGPKEMGDFVEKKAKNNNSLLTLFDNLNSESDVSKQFSTAIFDFYSDNGHLKQASNLIKKWFISMQQSFENGVENESKINEPVILRKNDELIEECK